MQQQQHHHHHPRPAPVPIGADQAVQATTVKPTLPPAEEIAAAVHAHKEEIAASLLDDNSLKPLAQSVVSTVKATVPVLRKQGTVVISRFYAMLFERHPELRVHFTMDRQARGAAGAAGVPAQVAALSRAMLMYAGHVDDVAALLPWLKVFGTKHVSRGVRRGQYHHVICCLLDALKVVLGERATPKVMKAWKEAFARLSTLARIVENDIRRKAALRAGYDGFIDMTVVEVSHDCDAIEIVMQPPDGIRPDADAGMFLAIKLKDIPDMGATMLTASILRAPRGVLRLRIPRNGERANEFLITTVKVGDILRVGMPVGEPKSEAFHY